MYPEITSVLRYAHAHPNCQLDGSDGFDVYLVSTDEDKPVWEDCNIGDLILKWDFCHDDIKHDYDKVCEHSRWVNGIVDQLHAGLLANGWYQVDSLDGSGNYLYYGIGIYRRSDGKVLLEL